jgi:hypothetical protein
MNITIPDTTMRFQLSGDRALTLEGEDFEEFALGLWDKIGKHSISKTTRLDSREIRENLAAWLKMKTGTQLKESEAELIWIHACDALQRNLGTFGLDTVGTARLDNRVVLDQSTIALAETISAELDWIKEHRKLVNGRSYATNSEFAVLLAWDELRHRLPVYERLVWAMQHSSCAARPLVCREDGGHGPRILLSYDQDAVHRHAGTPMREHTAHYLLQEGQKLTIPILSEGARPRQSFHGQPVPSLIKVRFERVLQCKLKASGKPIDHQAVVVWLHLWFRAGEKPGTPKGAPPSAASSGREEGFPH